MDERAPAEVLLFTPKETPEDGADPIDQAGEAIVAMLHQAAQSSKENMERAVSMAHRLSIKLRAAEDRIAQLQGEVEHLQNGANRAEQWLETIKQEIDDNLIPSIAPNPQPLAVH